MPIIGRDLFFLFVVARPLAFGSLPARIMPTLRVGIWEILRISHYNGKTFGFAIWKNVPFFHYKSQFNRDLFFLFVVARPLAFGSLPAPMHTPSGCAYGCPKGAPIIGRDLFFYTRAYVYARETINL